MRTNCKWCHSKIKNRYKNSYCKEKCYLKSKEASKRYSKNYNEHLKRIGGKVVQSKVTKEMVKQIARKYGRTQGAADLAREFDVSRQRIQQIAKKLREQGVDIPHIQVKTIIIKKIIDDAVIDLKNESPDLFEE